VSPRELRFIEHRTTSLAGGTQTKLAAIYDLDHVLNHDAGNKEAKSNMLYVQEIELFRLTACRNNRRINDPAVEAVAKSIQAFGFNVPILCDERLRIIAGHTRWKAAKRLGLLIGAEYS